jgi:hypothetical protein
MSTESFLKGLPGIGGLFGDSESERASKEQRQLYDMLSNQYQAQRAPMRQARMNALSQSMSLFNPMNELMKRQYGPDAGFDFGQLLQDPMRDFDKGVAEETQGQDYQRLARELNEANRSRKRSPGISPDPITSGNQLEERYRDKVRYNESTGQWEVA